MKNWSFYSLRFLLPTLVLAGLAISALSLSFQLNRASRLLVHQKVQERLSAIADSLFFSLQTRRGDFFAPDNQASLQQVFEKTVALRQMIGVYFVSPDLKILIDGERIFQGEKLPGIFLEHTKKSLESLSPVKILDRHEGIESVIEIRPLEGGKYDSIKRSSLLGALVLRYDLTHENQQLSEHYSRAILIQTLVIFLVCFFVYLVTLKKFILPLRKIKRIVKSVGNRDFDFSAEPFAHDELGDVASTIKSMADQLKNSTISKSYLDRILTSMTDMIFVFDLNGKLQKMNLSAQKRWSDDFKGISSLYEIFMEKGFSEKLISVVNGMINYVEDYETAIVNKFGSRFFMAISVSPIVGDLGVVEGLLFVARDISERKKVEHELDQVKAKSIASSKMASLGEMAGGVAHEINNPLAIIAQLSDQLGELVQEKSIDYDLLMKISTSIQQTTFRIAKIVSGLKSFSRDGGLDPFASTPISKIIEDVVILCTEKFRQNGITLVVDELKADIVIECRSVEVSQVLLNLLNNAFDAVAQFPENDRWVRLKIEISDLYIEFGVIDGGKGIAPEFLPKLFSPFFTTKEIGKGTGLGLSISKKIAENHGGTMFVDKHCPNTHFVVKILRQQKNKLNQMAG